MIISAGGKRIIWAQHLIFWGSLLFVTLYISLGIYDTQAAISRFVSATLLNIAVYIVGYYWLVDSYYEKQKYGHFFIAFLVTIFVSTVIRAVLERYFYLHMTPDLYLKPERRQMAIIMMYFSQAIILVVSCLLAVAKNKMLAEQRLVESDKVKVETELSLLKAKINPHFLLNTLNNIYYHAREEGSKSSEAIIQLSQLLQFTIYETARKRISLEREVEILQGLAELYRLRYKNELNIKIAVAGDAESVEVPPSIVLILLENALKHSGIGIDDDSFIDLKIEVLSDKLLVTVTNSAANADDAATSVYSGLGLSSLRGLLEMEYPNAHHLKTHKTDGVFYAEMEIGL